VLGFVGLVVVLGADPAADVETAGGAGVVLGATGGAKDVEVGVVLGAGLGGGETAISSRVGAPFC
jgi:hypothetical protein